MPAADMRGRIRLRCVVVVVVVGDEVLAAVCIVAASYVDSVSVCVGAVVGVAHR